MQNDYVQYAALSALLPSIRSTTSNDPALAVSDHRYLATTPQFALHNPANLHRMRLQTQVQRQMQQINAAIQLLEMQYDSIMFQIQNTACTSSLHSCTAMPQQRHTNTSVVLDQTTFAAKFALLRAESGVEDSRSFPSSESPFNTKRGCLDFVSRDSPATATVPAPRTSLNLSAHDPPFQAKRARLE